LGLSAQTVTTGGVIRTIGFFILGHFDPMSYAHLEPVGHIRPAVSRRQAGWAEAKTQ